MAKVFFGRMFVAEMLLNADYVATGLGNLGNENLIHEGDYVFVKYVGSPYKYNDDKKKYDGDPTYAKYKNEISYSINQLWKAKSNITKTIQDGQDKYRIEFDKFLTFDDIELSDFIRLDFFNLDISLLNKTQKSTGKSFVELSMVDINNFDELVKRCNKNADHSTKYSQEFSNYVTNSNHRRRIVLNNDSTATSIDIKINPSDYTALPNDSFMRGVINKQNISGIQQYVNLFDSFNNYQKGTVKAQYYRFLKGEDVTPSLVGLWDFHCGTATKNSLPKSQANISGTTIPSTTQDDDEDINLEEENQSPESPYSYDDSEIKNGENLVVYGTPGCGKSHYLKNNILKDFNNDNIIRVTFHQDYTYTDFVGQILPVISQNNSVSYRFVPGPFTLALERAIIWKNQKIALVIEELNRGNTASIFGDLFQLLDRKVGISEYELTNVQIVDYLNDCKDFKEDKTHHRFATNYTYSYPYIKLPSNLFIYATMNTGDQNVFTLDTAFKRRWKFKKISNTFTDEDNEIAKKFVPGLTNVTWQNFVTTINAHIIGDNSFISEDKQLGKYFVSTDMLVNQDDPHTKEKKENFAYKIFEYIWNDVAKFNKDRWFDTKQYKTLDSIILAWEQGKGEAVFNSVKFGNT